MKSNLLMMVAISSILHTKCDETDSLLDKLVGVFQSMESKLALTMIRTGKLFEVQNGVYSGFRMVSFIISMYSVGSKELRDYLETYDILKFSKPLKTSVCMYMKMLSNFSGTTEQDSNITFKSMLFYRPDMVLKKSIENGCFNNNSQSLDFKDTSLAQETINDWFRHFSSNSYLASPLPADTNEMLMNGMHLEIDMFVPYGFSNDINFTNYEGKKLSVKAMEKTATFFCAEDPENGFFMIREDFRGGRLSSVLIYSHSDDFNPTINKLANGDVLKNLLIKSMKTENECKIKLIMPTLQMETRDDILSILGRLYTRKYQSRNDSLSGLTGDDSSMKEFPYSEFINIGPTVSSKDIPVNKTVVINKPFLFVIMDRKFNLPLKSVYYIGVTPSYETYEKKSCKLVCV